MAGSKSASATDRRLRCSGCAVLKEKDQFHMRSNRACGVMSLCRECESARQRARRDRGVDYGKIHYEKNRTAILDRERQQKYGLTREQYDVLLKQQDGVCALCAQPERHFNRRGELRLLSVDHDHACCPGKESCGRCVRGLLCSSCNLGLGLFGDSPELLNAAVQYVGRCTPLQLVSGGDSHRRI